MKSEILLSASILSADFSRLGEEIEAVAGAGADMIHLDVMDGHFVPNITLGPAVIKSVRKRTKLPFDTHLMVREPYNLINDFIEAGCDIITVQAEATTHLQRTLCKIREKGAKAGVAFNPATPLDCLEYILDVTDLILVMSVNPGYSGQKFIPSSLEKIRKARQMIERSARDIYLQVDGGISPETSASVIEAGANLLVSASAIFGSGDYAQVINSIKNAGKK